MCGEGLLLVVNWLLVRILFLLWLLLLLLLLDGRIRYVYSHTGPGYERARTGAVYRVGKKREMLR